MSAQTDHPTALPSAARLALQVLLNHVEPGWENCAAIVRAWMAGDLASLEGSEAMDSLIATGEREVEERDAEHAAENAMTLAEWVAERLENALRIAETRAGAERQGWLDDAFRFRKIIAALMQLEYADELCEIDRVHGPEDCPRRCVDCADGGHHWYPAFDGDDDEGDEPMAETYHAHPAVTEFKQDAFFVCRHCDAWTTCDYAELVLGVEG